MFKDSRLWHVKPNQEESHLMSLCPGLTRAWLSLFSSRLTSTFLIMSFMLINNLLIFFLYYITLLPPSPLLCFQEDYPFCPLLFSPLSHPFSFLLHRNTKWPRKRKWKFKLSDEILADIAYGFNNEEKCYVLRISQGFENKRIGGAHDWYDAFCITNVCHV